MQAEKPVSGDLETSVKVSLHIRAPSSGDKEILKSFLSQASIPVRGRLVNFEHRGFVFF